MDMPSKARPRLGIVRIQDSRSHRPGWQVKIRRQYKDHYRYFTDEEYGGKRAALRAAQIHRDTIAKKMPRMTRRQRAAVLMQNNTSGMVGVHRRVKLVTRGRKRWKYPVWTATGSPSPRERKIKDFYVHVWGERTAKRLAIAQRRLWEKMMNKHSI